MRGALSVCIAALIAGALSACDSDSAPAVTLPPAEWVALNVDGTLILADASGGRPASIVAGGVAGAAAWSPNGQLFAFVADGALWLSRVNEAPRRIEGAGDAESRVTSLIWTPEGAAIAYSTAGEQAGVWLLDLAKGDPQRLYEGAAEVSGWWNQPEQPDPLLLIHEIATGDAYLVDPQLGLRWFAFSGDDPHPHPHDARVLFVDAGGDLQLWTPATGARPLTWGFDGVLGATWSPDGRAILFEQGTRWDRPAGLWLIEEVGAAPRFVVAGRSPAWAAEDGAFAFERDGEVRIATLGGGEERLVGVGSAAALPPAWPPIAAEGGGPAEVPLRNLLSNGSFEEGLQGWFSGLLTPPGALRTEDDSYIGDAAAEIVFGPSRSYFAANVTVLKEQLDGHPLTFSAWVKTEASDVRLRHIANNSDSERLDSAAHPGDGKWHRLVLSFTPSYDDPEPTEFVQFGLFREEGSAIALLDGAQLELGGTASSYDSSVGDVLSWLRRPQPVSSP